MRHTQFPAQRRSALASIMAVTLGLAGCGGSDSTVSQTTINGQAIAGAVTGTLTVSDASGKQLASASVNAGAFSVTIPDSKLDDELSFTVSGSYVDEVSGETITLDANNALALTLAANHFSAGQSGNAPVTPDSTIIHHLIRNHAMSMTQAQTAFQNAFGYLPDMDAVPFDPSSTDSSVAGARPQADKDAAFRAGVFSQLASDLGLSGNDIAALLAALADDLADDTLDGIGSTGSAVSIGALDLKTLHQSNPMSARLLQAHGAFAGSDKNSAALSAPGSGLPSIAYDAPGASKTITSASGRSLIVSLDTAANAPISAGYWTARVQHKITLIDGATQQPIDLASDVNFKGVSQHPYMHMLSGHDHTTPHGHDAVSGGNGVYYLDAYYVMASEMGMGASATPMGLWDYPVNIKEDSDGDGTVDVTTAVMFHPQVKMPMNGTFYAEVSNASDKWTNMMGMNAARKYRLWLHEAKANNDGSHDLTVFVSTQDIGNMSMGAMSGHSMMSFPAVYSGRVLHGPSDEMGMRPEVTVTSVSVEVSLDGGATWQMLTAADDGLFSIAALSGLNTAAQNTLAFRLSVNGNLMSTAAGGNAELLFTAPTP